MFVYKYFTDDLLSLARKDLPIVLTKRTLRDTLRRLTALHYPPRYITPLISAVSLGDE